MSAARSICCAALTGLDRRSIRDGPGPATPSSVCQVAHRRLGLIGEGDRGWLVPAAIPCRTAQCCPTRTVPNPGIEPESEVVARVGATALALPAAYEDRAPELFDGAFPGRPSSLRLTVLSRAFCSSCVNSVGIYRLVQLPLVTHAV